MIKDDFPKYIFWLLLFNSSSQRQTGTSPWEPEERPSGWMLGLVKLSRNCPQQFLFHIFSTQLQRISFCTLKLFVMAISFSHISHIWRIVVAEIVILVNWCETYFFSLLHILCGLLQSRVIYHREELFVAKSDIGKNCDLPTNLLNRSGVELKNNFRATILKSEHKIME